MATTKRTTKQAAPTSVKRAVKRTAKKAAKKVSSSAAAKRSRKVAKKAPAAKKAAVKTAKRKTATRKTATRKTATRKVAVRKAATRPGRGTAGDAIALLKGDHREVEQLFKRFEKAGDSAYKEKGRLVASMIEALSRHAAIEEMVFYPAVRREVPRQESSVLEALEEHHVVKWLLSELEGMAPSAERFEAKVTVLMESVRHHVKEEENDLFPKVRAKFGRRELLEIGDALRAAKRRAPTHPHPRAADTPPGNVLMGSAVAVMDKALDVGKKTVERVKDELPSL
jgi:hemerythrin superfamily protein